MKYRYLGHTGVKVSGLCLGTMPFGGDADAQAATALFAAATDAGVNFFDTADVYNEGRSEQLLGKLIAPMRDQVVIASKAFFPTGKDVNARGSSRFHLRAAAEASLRRLGTDRIEVYYIHRFDEGTPLEETLRGLEELVRAGKILYPAVSNYAAWQVARALGIAERHGWAPVTCLQPMYNLVKRQAEVELLPMAHAERLGVFPYSPLGGGLLSGKYGRDRRPSDGRLVENKMYGYRYGDPGHYDVAERFNALAAKWGMHPATLAVAWVASHPAVTAPIIGARNAQQLADSLAAADVELTAEQRAEVSALTPTPPPATDRNEEGVITQHGR